VDVRATALEDLRGMWRIQRAHSRDAESLATLRAAVLGGDMPVPQPPLAVQVGRFAAIGVLSTLAYAILYLALRLALAPQVANFGALLLTAVVNTAANRRYTFAVRGRRRLARHHLEGMLVFGLGWAITASSLGALHLWAPQAGSIWELIVLTAANLAATLLRFVLFKTWVFRRRDPGPAPGPASDPHPDRQPAHTFSSELKSGRN
jgi:putative flippase GtrA